jgi:hypothetical protein
VEAFEPGSERMPPSNVIVLARHMGTHKTVPRDKKVITMLKINFFISRFPLNKDYMEDRCRFEKKAEPPSSRQPGYLIKTRGFPSPPLGGFGYIWDFILSTLFHKCQDNF